MLAVAAPAPKKRFMYQEERWALPAKAVQQIMQNETCTVLPPLFTPCLKKQFYVVLKDVDTQQEYMHPDPVKTLDSYQLHFFDCYLLKTVDLTKETDTFPPLHIPGENGMGPVTLETFHLKNSGRTFSVSAFAAPEALNDITIFVKSPDLPLKYENFQALYTTSIERRACLRHFAMLGLATAYNMQITPMQAPSIPPEMQEMAKDAALQHGDDAVQNSKGVYHNVLSGVCPMHQLERTAASVSLPVVIQNLFFLQFNLDDTPVRYHILAPNKFAYMVHVPNLGGWEIYYQVNMNAPLQALQYAFLGSLEDSILNSRSAQRFDKTEAFVSSLFAAMSLRAQEKSELISKMMISKILDQKQKLADALKAKPTAMSEPKDWAADVFYDKMLIKGMEFLQKDILNQTKIYQNYTSMQDARPLLQYLLTFYENRGLVYAQPNGQPPVLSQPFSVVKILKIALQACMGCLEDVWKEFASGADIPAKVKGFLDILQQNPDAPSPFIQTEIIPIVIRACMQCPSTNWYEHASHLLGNPQGLPKTSSVSVQLARTFLHNSENFESFFPYDLFFDPALKIKDKKKMWIERVKQACMEDQTLAQAKQLYVALQTLQADRYDPADEKKREMDYCMAVGYSMLTCNHDKKFNDIQPM